MPAQFDRSSVENLIQTIDQGQNAIILQFGYFLRRSPKDFSQKEGIALLQKAVEGEKPGSKKWFALESVLGFGAIYSGQGQGEVGFKAYNDLFSQASDAEATGATETVQRAAREYVGAIRGDFGWTWPQHDGRAILLKALKVHMALLRQHPEGKLPIPWDMALKATDSQDDGASLVDETIKAPTQEKSFDLLWCASVVYGPTHPDRAVTMLEAAKPLFPPQAKNNLKIVNAFYQSLVQDLEDQNRIGEAIAAQRELIGLTKKGNGKLALLQYLTADTTTAKATLMNVVLTTSDDQEIVETGGQLIDLGSQSPDVITVADDGLALLKAYLIAPRKRDLEQELRARFKAGFYLAYQGKNEEAQELLSVGLNQPISTRIEQDYSDRIKKLLGDLKNNPKK